VNQNAAVELIVRAADRKDQSAKQHLEQTVQLDPDSAPAHNQLARLLVGGPNELRDPPAAVRFARLAIELNPCKAPFWNTLGVALYQDGQYDEAIDTLEQSLQRGDEATAGFDLILLALCQARVGNQSSSVIGCPQWLH
jgi:Tfp pilus assembly protein PilF